jgi:hypothetical protein
MDQRTEALLRIAALALGYDVEEALELLDP